MTSLLFYNLIPMITLSLNQQHLGKPYHCYPMAQETYDSQPSESVKRARESIGSVSATKQRKQSKTILSDDEISSPGSPTSTSSLEENRPDLETSNSVPLAKFVVEIPPLTYSMCKEYGLELPSPVACTQASGSDQQPQKSQRSRASRKPKTLLLHTQGVSTSLVKKTT